MTERRTGMGIGGLPCGVCGPCVAGNPDDCDAAERRERFVGLVEQESDVLEGLADDD